MRMTVLERANSLIKTISGIVLGLMILLVISQVLFRYIFKLPVAEVEEYARFSLIWAVMLGSTIAVRQKSHIAVEFFVEKFPAGVQRVFKAIAYVAYLIFMVILVVYGWILAQKGMTQISPSTQIPVGWIAMSIPISGLISLLYIFENFIKDVIRQEPNNSVHEEAV